jgi:hypothetical protein
VKIGALRKKLKCKYDDAEAENRDGQPADPMTAAYQDNPPHHEGEARE